ncbi:DUF192 domain-containing protein [Patescibacteria group bacterium]|nr:DUF192 domain-containing protein [Patescibacteria group bacterium]
MSGNRITVSLFVLLAVVAALVFFKWHAAAPLAPTSVGGCGSYATTTVSIGAAQVQAEIADTDCKRELGLSYRNSLAGGSGMLFVFPNDGFYAFWMKDMAFPLDMVWVGTDLSVVGVAKSVSPATYDASDPQKSQTFGGNWLAEYVIELPAGFADAYGVKVGTKIFFSAKSL